MSIAVGLSRERAFWKLGRSSGMVAANRGLVTGGPYAVVRHPLYSAHMLGGIGYLMQSFSAWNVAVDVAAVGFQLLRIVAEERHLSGPAYAAYRTRVAGGYARGCGDERGANCADVFAGSRTSPQAIFPKDTCAPELPCRCRDPDAKPTISPVPVSSRAIAIMKGSALTAAAVNISLSV